MPSVTKQKTGCSAFFLQQRSPFGNMLASISGSSRTSSAHGRDLEVVLILPTRSLHLFGLDYLKGLSTQPGEGTASQTVLWFIYSVSLENFPSHAWGWFFPEVLLFPCLWQIIFCMSLYSLRSTPEGWGVSRTTSGTLLVQWIILNVRLPQGSQLGKTLGDVADLPSQHFHWSGRPQIAIATSYVMEIGSGPQ